jgi:hypothetical protein
VLKRKAALAGLLAGAPSALQLVEHLPGDGARILEQACRLQVAATQGGQKVRVPSESVAEHAAQQFESFESRAGALGLRPNGVSTAKVPITRLDAGGARPTDSRAG